MAQTLLVYWQHLTRRFEAAADAEGIDAGRTDAPVLDLAACFANPVIAARHAADVVTRLSEVSSGRIGPR